MHDLKGRTLRGRLVRSALLRGFCPEDGRHHGGGSARLLSPKDFGPVGMVTGFIGVLSFMRDFGLSFAAVQRTTISDEQSWTLSWVNILIGVLLWLIAVVMAPAIAVFYSEARLFGVTAVMALGFLFNVAGFYWATSAEAARPRQIRTSNPYHEKSQRDFGAE